MCLPPEDHAYYQELARGMDDEQLQKLDRRYQAERGTTVDMQLHSIVLWEMARRREHRLQQLKRSLWLSSRRGRCVEAVKRWLVRHRLWSSARQRVIEPDPPSLIRRYLWLVQALFWPLVMFGRLRGLIPQRKLAGLR